MCVKGTVLCLKEKYIKKEHRKCVLNEKDIQNQ